LLERIAALEKQTAQTQATQGPSITDEPQVEPGDTQQHLATTLTLSAVAEPRSRAGEFLRHLSTPSLVAGVTETFGGDPEATTRGSPLWEGISQHIRHPSGGARPLHIPRDEALGVLQAYLDVVDFRFPRLPVAKVRAGIEAISSEAGYARALARDPAHIFMAYLVVAIVPLVSDAYPVSQGSWVSAHLLTKCLALLDRVFRMEDGVDVIQCLHLLTVMAIHCSTAGSAWHLVGFAMNKCVALGYHRDDHTESLSPTEVQQRRWAFWGCYLLDRLICAALGRPYSIDDRDITVPLPQGEGPREMAYVHLFRYAVLLSKAVDESLPAKTTERLHGQALYWRATSPAQSDPSVADIHAYHTSLYRTLLLRIAIRDIVVVPPASSPDVIALEQLRMRDINHFATCRAVARSLDRARMVKRPYLSFLTGYSALSMGLTCLYHVVVSPSATSSFSAPAYSPSLVQGGSALNSYSEPREILDLACRKLEIVGRQFPRLHEYLIIFDKLRQSVDKWLLSATVDDVAEVGLAIAGIGPLHLRQLAEAILSIINSA
jgi:hypothetical protein